MLVCARRSDNGRCRGGKGVGEGAIARSPRERGTRRLLSLPAPVQLNPSYVADEVETSARGRVRVGTPAVCNEQFDGAADRGIWVS